MATTPVLACGAPSPLPLHPLHWYVDSLSSPQHPPSVPAGFFANMADEAPDSSLDPWARHVLPSVLARLVAAVCETQQASSSPLLCVP